MLNGTGSQQEKQLYPNGKWKLIANNQIVDYLKGVKKDKYKELKGGAIDIIMEAESLKIWVKNSPILFN